MTDISVQSKSSCILNMTRLVYGSLRFADKSIAIEENELEKAEVIYVYVKDPICQRPF